MTTTNSKTELFESAPISSAVIALVIPTIISQLVHVIYNMADTFFIGQLNDPSQVAASTVAMPLFLCSLAITNLFGIGGSSFISRCLGVHNKERARNAASFCFWMVVGIGLAYGIVIYVFAGKLLPLVGATSDTYDYCLQYVFWTATIGTVPTCLPILMGHLLRAEGYSKEASIGMTLGAFLNIALDPLFIFVFKMNIQGAAIATMLSNVVSSIYFFLFIFKKRDVLNMSIAPKFFKPDGEMVKDIFFVGLSSFVMSMMATVSNIFLNKIISGFSTTAIAGMGIAKKIDTLVFAVSNGMTQGVMPLIAYNYAAKNIKRMKDSIKVTFIYSLVLAFITTGVLLGFSRFIIKFFINDAQTIEYGGKFLRCLCLTCPCFAILGIIITIFQATGHKVQPTFLSFMRKGVIDVIAMFILSKNFGVEAIGWANPINDVIATIFAVIIFIPFIKSLSDDSLLHS